MALLTISDAIVKWLSPQLAMHEIMLFRSLFAMIIVALIIKLEGGFAILKTRRPGLHFLRGFMLVLANMFFFLGLSVMPLAETLALFFTAPLFICLLSQPILGESVTRSGWLAIFLGLAGVIIMLKPGTDVFHLASLLPVFAALSYASMQMMTRKLGRQEKAATMTFYIQLAFIITSCIIGLSLGDGRFSPGNDQMLDFLLRAWVWPDFAAFKLLAFCGLLISLSGYLLSQAYRIGQATVIAPFEYTSLPFALLLGYYLWGDWPDLVAFVGSGLIIGSSLLVVYLQKRKK